MPPAITQTPTNGSATDRLLSFAGQVVDTVGSVAAARAAAATPPAPSPTSAPRIGDPDAKSLPPAPVGNVTAQVMPNQWKLWIGGSIAIGAVITFALLALRRPRAA